ncbi:MAG: hypothetical protein AAF499_09640, partial [Pseudomonadota bacterium]
MNLGSRLENLTYHSILLIALCLATLIGGHYAVTLDVTRDARNSLNKRSESVLTQLDQPVVIELYAGKGSLLVQAGRDLVERYTRSTPFVQFRHVDIDRDPHIAREMQISGHGDVVIKLGDRRRRTQALTEAAITGAIESLMIAETRR